MTVGRLGVGDQPQKRHGSQQADQSLITGQNLHEVGCRAVPVTPGGAGDAEPEQPDTLNTLTPAQAITQQ